MDEKKYRETPNDVDSLMEFYEQARAGDLDAVERLYLAADKLARFRDQVVADDYYQYEWASIKGTKGAEKKKVVANKLWGVWWQEFSNMRMINPKLSFSDAGKRIASEPKKEGEKHYSDRYIANILSKIHKNNITLK